MNQDTFMLLKEKGDLMADLLNVIFNLINIYYKETLKISIINCLII